MAGQKGPKSPPFKNSSFPNEASDAFLQHETGNPKDFRFHPTMAMPQITVTKNRRGVEGSTPATMAASVVKPIVASGDAAKNRAMKQALASKRMA